jgi:hypothetical protein
MWWWLAGGALLILVWIGINVSVLRSRPKDPAPAEQSSEAAAGASYQGGPAPQQSSVSPAAGPVVEPQVESREESGGAVFRGRRERFLWYPSRVEALADERWRAVFEWLSDAREVLGWIAFEGDTVGAADRNYDESLLDVLREHRRSVARVQREVGLSAVREWLIVGPEGTVGVLAAPNEVWLAVFLDQDADVQALGARLSAYLDAPERTV